MRLQNKTVPDWGDRPAAVSRRLTIGVCLAFLASGWACTSTLDAGELPNFVLCMGDDHGWEETGYNGHPHVITPVLDEMSKSGLRFDRFYAGHPSCSPTRGSFLTGRHPNRYGTFTPGYSIRSEEITIARLLKDAGYECGHFGKWHLGPVKASSPTNPAKMGFDHYVSHDNFFELNPPLSEDGRPHQVIRGESSAIVIDRAIKFMENCQRQGKPFLAVVWFGSPHEPYSGMPEDLALYDSVVDKYQDRTVRLTSNETGKQVKRPLGEVLRERLAEITAMDRSLGTLRKYLSDQGIRDNTLLWYCGDNGTPSSGIMASPFRGQKGTLFEGGIRVPGIIEWPSKIGKPRVTNHPAVTSDILPTLCSIAGVDTPGRPIDGLDLMPVLEGTRELRPSPICFWTYNTRKESKGREPYFTAEQQKGTTPLVKLMGSIPTRNFKNFRHPEIQAWNYSGNRALVTDRYKLHVVQPNADKEPELLLFDLEKDPAETKNLAKTKPKEVEAMRTYLRTWQDSVLESLTEKDYGVR